ncbi:hypothetical protein SynA1840_00451 [Synechococcus sp. A18-40]|nr:hypothetical protein SynA1840_00451 [Synechococcus sp. A18-40]
MLFGNRKFIYYEGVSSLFHLLPVLFFCFHVGFPISYRPKRLKSSQERSHSIWALSSRLRCLFSDLASKYIPLLLHKKLTKCQIDEARELFNSAFRNTTSKEDLYNLHFGNVRVGDLIYDTYLKNTRLPTIDLNSKFYKQILLSSAEEYVYWRDLAARSASQAVVVSHTCYLLAIPARVFISANKRAYQVNHAGVYHVTRDRQWAYTEYYDFPSIAKSIPCDQLSLLKNEADLRINRRFSGEVGVDMKYSSASAYTNFSSTNKRLIRESRNLKILIAAHCLFDAPNGWGINIFPDFYEWLKFLSRLSLQTPYDWYLKTHPDFLPGNEDAISEIISDGNITIIPSKSSHHQIISEGVAVCLTVYGTIGFEYAALGKTVVNASLDNPHSKYSFNLHVGDKLTYENILVDLENNLIAPSRDDVLEYYAMKLFTNTLDWFYKDWDNLTSKIGGRVPHSPSDLFACYRFLLWNISYYLEYWRFLSPRLSRFLVSGSYKFYPRHE